ncbi:MAG TPA: short-chain dehydrogenase [Planctomycetaceae bacterium]|nr:short-chain dehydrogenase [Planctomycetaceae bacterium]
MELAGKVVLITGGTKGIGAATAVLMASLGADVAINGRHDDAEAKRIRDAIEGLGRRCAVILADVGKPDQATRCVAQAIDALGRLDVLVHSAGGIVTGSLLEVSPKAWHEAFDVHVHAAFHLVRAAVPEMKKNGEGAVVLISSVAGIRALPQHVAYQVAKGALPQFARAIAYELAADNIRVNAVAPGIIATRLHEGLSAERRKYNCDHRIPLHREGTPEQVARLITDLAVNDYVTGETVTIDGGLTMRIA